MTGLSRVPIRCFLILFATATLGANEVIDAVTAQTVSTASGSVCPGGCQRAIHDPGNQGPDSRVLISCDGSPERVCCCIRGRRCNADISRSRDVFCYGATHVPRTSIPDSAIFATNHKLSRVSDVSVMARDGARLQGWFIESHRSANRCVIVLHGIADSRLGSAGFAPMFLNTGYSVLVPDARAHGSSGGEFVTYGLEEKYDMTRVRRLFTRSQSLLRTATVRCGLCPARSI